MAKYHKDLEYHEDTKKKHSIKRDEIDFLMELQKELNTQDTVSTATPRYWVIKGTTREYGIDGGYADGFAVKIDSETIVIEEDIIEFIKNHLEENKDDYNLNFEFEGTHFIVKKNHGYEDDYDLENYNDVDDLFDELLQFDEHEILWYRDVDKIYENTMFLTQIDAENHLRANYYHYSEDAHTYCMCGWRSPRLEKLMEILETVDFAKLKEK